ncbi:MAG: glycosyltransferase involved in cell wall biosynthesis [Verrucomicrobiales bacterium]|jgi:glycosyltransferase involved in cell wall biosynthesis
MKLTFVFPCLNEEGTLGGCIKQVQASLDRADGLEYEIVVADNGSTDRSAEIAESLGARVVSVPLRGYGAALQGGINAARAPHVMFADADSTYLLDDALELYEKAIETDADMAIASRMTGKIENGAMPTLHRRLGTPVLTGLINLLFRGKLSDCNSGFRCLKKASYEKWDIRSNGMEFASELLIKALKCRAKMVEIPSGLNRGPEGREAHLRTWRDGMRHLLFIFAERPQLFEWLGLFILGVSSVLQLMALLIGPTQILGLNVFDLHSEALLLLAALTGTQFYLFSCVLYLRGKEKSTALTRKLIGLDEGVLFFLLLALFVGVFLVVASIVVIWMKAGFGGIDLTNSLLGIVHFLSVPGMLAIALLGIHVFKKTTADN